MIVLARVNCWEDEHFKKAQNDLTLKKREKLKTREKYSKNTTKLGEFDGQKDIS